MWTVMVNHHVHLMTVTFLKQQGTTHSHFTSFSLCCIFYSDMLRTLQTAMLILWRNLERSTVKSCQKDMRILRFCPRKMNTKIRMHSMKFYASYKNKIRQYF